MNQDWVEAASAAEFLGVKRETLYAYASRGLVESVPGPDGRGRRYRRSDLERLRTRRDSRAGRAAVAASALRFGEPVLDSSITHITDAGPLYRGRPAIDLAESGARFESIAELLWTGDLPDPPPAWGARDLGLDARALRALVPPGTPPLSVLAVAVPALGALDPDRFDARPEAVLPRARALLPRMVAALGVAAEGAPEADGTCGHVARDLARALGARSGSPAVRAIDRALVLCADHELNASAFAARVAASAGADVYASTGAALAALSGPLHGGGVERCEALIEEAGAPERAARAIADRTRRGSRVPGFGHPIYPGGDPRAVPLLETAYDLAPRSRRVGTALALVEAMRESRGIAPNVDLALAALGSALGLARGQMIGVFAIGRAAGWVAHVLEQYEAGYLLRPRARYVGSGAETNSSD